MDSSDEEDIENEALTANKDECVEETKTPRKEKTLGDKTRVVTPGIPRNKIVYKKVPLVKRRIAHIISLALISRRNQETQACVHRNFWKQHFFIRQKIQCRRKAAGYIQKL